MSGFETALAHVLFSHWIGLNIYFNLLMVTIVDPGRLAAVRVHALPWMALVSVISNHPTGPALLCVFNKALLLQVYALQLGLT